MSSSFHFINKASSRQAQRDASASMFVDAKEHKQSRAMPRFSSSFILEEAFDDDYSGSPDSTPHHKQKLSAFGFINQNAPEILDKDSPPLLNKSSEFSFMNQPLIAPKDRSSSSSSVNSNTNLSSSMSSKRQQQPSKSLLETDNEMKLLHLSVASQKIENQHKETLDALKRNSQRLPLFHNKLKQIKQQIEDAIATQDFDLAQQHKQQRDRLQGHLQTCLLASDLWSRIGHETTQRHGLIDQRLTCFRSLKQERARQLAQYNSNSRLQDRQSRLDKSRADLQQERSELSFDLDLYRQNLSDLASQMEEAVQAETEQRAALLARSDELGRDIDALRAELERLEGERREVLVQVDEVDADIKSKLDVFQEEQDHLKSEKKMIEERQQELKEKTENLDKEDEQIEREMKWHRDETRRRQEELDEFEKEIDALMDKQTKEDEENEVIRDITQLVYQHQDAKLTEYRDSLKEDRALLESKKKKLELIQKRVWETQERASQWQETVTKQTQRLKSLTKLQEMAIQNDDFETAAKLARDIKLVRIEDAKQTRNDVQEEARQLEDQLDKTTIELSQLKIDLSSKREHFGKQLSKELKSLKEELEKRQKTTTSELLLKPMIQLELESVNAMLLDCQDLIDFL